VFSIRFHGGTYTCQLFPSPICVRFSSSCYQLDFSTIVQCWWKFPNMPPKISKDAPIIYEHCPRFSKMFWLFPNIPKDFLKDALFHYDFLTLPKMLNKNSNTTCSIILLDYSFSKQIQFYMLLGLMKKYVVQIWKEVWD